jgi:hypothetical protein
MTTSRLLGAAAAAALVLGAGACGEADSAVATDADIPVQTVDGEVLVSCSGEPGWLPSAMAGGFEGETPRAEIEVALDAIAVQPGLSAETSRVLPEGGRTPWVLLSDTSGHLTLGLGAWSLDGPARDAVTMDLELEDGTWVWQGHGNCWHLAPVLRDGDEMWVNVTADSVPTDTTDVPVGVTELACTGSRDPLPHLHDPVVVETAEDVTVYWTSEPPDGDQQCPGNPTATQTLVLDEPLGDRPLLDGSRWPPAPVG